MDQTLDEQLAFEEMRRAVREVLNAKLEAVGIKDIKITDFSTEQQAVFATIIGQTRLEFDRAIVETLNSLE